MSVDLEVPLPAPPVHRDQTRILLLRHAETAAPDRFHGAESDVPLGPRGHQQAATVAQQLALVRPAALYCSGMLRARQTATPIGLACRLEPQIVPELHERIMGPLSGALRAEAHEVYDLARRRWEAGALDHTHPGGESYAAIRDRVVPAFTALAERHPGGTVVVVAHGVVIRVLLTTLVAGLSPTDFGSVSIDFVGIHDLSYDGKRWNRRERVGSGSAHQRDPASLPSNRRDIL